MNAMEKKLNKTSGFTLVEMLIVVAIIAILIAISIPLVKNALEKSRHAVDDANIRDAISLGNIEYLTNVDFYAKPSGPSYYFGYKVGDNHQGQLSERQTTKNSVLNATMSTQAQCVGRDDDSKCPLDEANQKFIYVEIKADGTVTAGFSK